MSVLDYMCRTCGKPVDPAFWSQSGALCGYCLADYGIPLTVVGADRPWRLVLDHELGELG